MKLFIAFATQQLRALVYYRFESVVRILYGLLAMYGARSLWVVLYRQDPSLVDRPLPQMITYAMMAMAIDIMFYPSGDNTPLSYIDAQISSGRIDTDLLKPMDFQQMMLVRNAGCLAAQGLILVLPCLMAGILFMGLKISMDMLQTCLFILSLALAYLILFSMNFLIGMISFLTINITHVRWAYNGVVALLSGKLIPLWLFPAWLEDISNALPFRCLFDIPLRLCTDASYRSFAFRALGLQGFWAVTLFLCGKMTWNRIHHRLVIQGG